jgi:hypothetical protein
VVSAYVSCPDVTATVTLTGLPGCGVCARRSLGGGRHRLAGSALAQVFGQVGDEPPDVEDPGLLARAFDAVQRLLAGGLVSAGHDRSDGGLATTLLEMAFAGDCGIDVDLHQAGPTSSRYCSASGPGPRGRPDLLRGDRGLPTTTSRAWRSDGPGGAGGADPLGGGSCSTATCEAARSLGDHLFGSTGCRPAGHVAQEQTGLRRAGRPPPPSSSPPQRPRRRCRARREDPGGDPARGSNGDVRWPPPSSPAEPWTSPDRPAGRPAAQAGPRGYRRLLLRRRPRLGQRLGRGHPLPRRPAPPVRRVLRAA